MEKVDGSYAYYLSDWQRYQTRKEVDFIKKCVRIASDAFDLESPVFVNIGAGAGTSTIAILEENNTGVIFSIDILATGSEIYTNEHLRLAEANLGLDGEIIKIWGDSKTVGKRFPINVNFVLIDGGHEEHEINGDLDMWLDKIKSGGVVMIHDYGSRHWPKVKEAIDNRLASSDQYEFLGLVDTMIAFQVK
jgi:predicted O-methyltransferase YrrM